MKCPKCGYLNQDQSQFCGKCAAPLQSSGDISETKTKTLDLSMIEELAIGSTYAGRYQIIEEVGKGGMGKVYKAFDKEVQENVALKLLRLEITAKKKVIQRFRNELKIARKITHKNVCRMYDLNKEGETSYITMEYVQGEDLKRSINRVGPVTVGKTIFIARQICEGLAEAHKLGIVHRDLKPHNVMIDRHGDAKIMDFGIAQSLETKELTDVGSVIGTPQYMSPEQIEGKEIDQRSDIYSLGILIYEMVTGQLPFEADTPLSLAIKHKTETPPDPRTYNPQLPADFCKLILKCLEKAKEKRPQNADTLHSELCEIEKKMPSTERFLPKGKFKVEIKRRALQSFGVPHVLILVVLIVIAGYFVGRLILPPQKTEAEIISRPAGKIMIVVLPFKDLSPGRDQEILCEGMTEAIISKLSSIPGLQVISYRLAEKYKDTEKNIMEIGEELNVENILIPSLHKEGNRLRINAQLTNAKEGFNIRSFEYEEELNSVFRLQDDISMGIIQDLKVQLQKGQWKVDKTREPKDFRAYEYYLRGKHFEKQYGNFGKIEDFNTAVKWYEEAIKIEPYALAYWGLGNAYESRYVGENYKKYLDLMLEYYQSAYEIAPDLAEANIGLGWTYFYKENLDQAYLYFKKASEIDPHNPQINFDIGSFLKSIGLFRQAIVYFSRAIELDPYSIYFYRIMANCYMYLGEFEEAVASTKKALDIKSVLKSELDDFRLHLNYSRQLIMMKKYTEAEGEIALAEELKPDSVMIHYLRGWIQAAKGEKERALELSKNADPFASSYLLTSIYALLGMKDEAIQNINEVIEQGFQYAQDYLYSYPFLINNPCYENLYNDSRFQDILSKEKEKYEEKLEKYGQL